MPEKIQLWFTETMAGVVWRTLADPAGNRLFLEIRDPVKKQARFSALHLTTCTWLWKDLALEEPWWVSLQATSGDIALFTLYTDTNNPDKKSLMAFDVLSQKTLWWRNNFTLAAIDSNRVAGVDSKFGAKQIIIDITDGSEVAATPFVLPPEQNLMITRPFQYAEGSVHFETVQRFLQMKDDISPIITIEYCEYHSLILISAFTGQEDLANYLFVFNSAGELVLKETLGEHLKGIALDTFFIFSGYLIFVKNKCELVSYKL